jgi:hypothetical protein
MSSADSASSASRKRGRSTPPDRPLVQVDDLLLAPLTCFAHALGAHREAAEIVDDRRHATR